MWNCKACGGAGSVGESCCAMCRTPRESVVRVEFAGSGKVATLRMTSVFGQANLRSYGGSDGQFASEPQFTLVHAEDGSWAALSAPSAKHPTLLDGCAILPGGAAIRDGAVLTIGPERLRIVLRLNFT